MLPKLNPPPPEGGGFDGRLKSPKVLADRCRQSFGDLKVSVVLGYGTLLSDVLRDGLVSDVAARRYEIPSRPKVPTPELPVRLRKSLIR